MASKMVCDQASKMYGMVKEYFPEPLSRPVPLVLTATVGSLGVWLAWRSWCSRTQPLPPSPPGWPLVGNMLDLSEEFHKDVIRLQKANNLPDVLTLRLGPGNKTVMLNSYAAIKDAFVSQGDLFANRPFSPVLEVMQLHGDLTKDFLDPSWKEGRAFIMLNLRNMGFGTRSEDKILEQIERIMNVLDKSCEDKQPREVSSLFSKTATNIIFQILFGKVYEFDDPEFLGRIRLIQKWYKTLAAIYFPLSILPFWLGKWLRGKEAYKATEDNRKYIRDEIREHLRTIDYDEPRDFLDVYLTKRKGAVDETCLANTLFLFLPDTTDSVGHFSEWVILYIVHHRSVMIKMQEEIEKITGGNRLVKWSDKANLPYVESVILEVMRIRCLSSLTVEHCPIRDCQFRGYHIPKGTPVLANLYAAMMDPEVFDNPDEFNPDRWLTTEGKLGKTDKWIPFGIGHRMCVGDQIVKIQVFLTVTNLIQRYNMSFPTGEPEPSLEPVKGTMTTTPQTFKLLFELRK